MLLVLLAGMAVAGIGVVAALNWPMTSATGTNPENAARVSLGKAVYAANCASCHGANLAGQADWRVRKPDGRLPAPPHDETGHTWHHPDPQLFEITKSGVSALVPGYESDMPAFGSVLSDEEIWAVLSYIKSTWSLEIRRRQDRRSQGASQ